MATLNIGGQRVKVGDAFLQMTPEQQQQAVEEIARSLPSPAGGQTRARYDDALQNVRETQFPHMTDEQWTEYSKTAFAPYSLSDLARHGGTLGLTDELGAAVGAAGSQVRQWMGQESPGFGEAYGTYKAAQEAQRDLGREQAGVLGVGAELLGGVTSVRSLPSLGPSAPLWQRSLHAGGQGAALGGAYGGGAADENRIQNALLGAGVGGVVGAAVPAVAAGVSKAYQNVANRSAANKAAGRAGMSPEAARFLQETVSVDDSLSNAGYRRMRGAGNEAMLADAGPSARNALDTAIQSSGRAGSIAQKRIAERVARDSKAVHAALDSALGRPAGVQTLRGNIRQSTAAARSEAYNTAYDAPIDYATGNGRLLQGLLKRVKPSVISEANELMRAEGFQSKQILAQIADDGTVTYQRLPDVRQIDYITRALRDVADVSDGAGKLGGQTNKGRVYGGLADNIRDVLKSAVPEYGKALETAADAISRSKAVKTGSELLRPSTTRDEIANWVVRATKPERDAAAQGLRSQVDDMLARVQRTVMDGDVEAREAIAALKALSSRGNRAKITTLIGAKKAGQLFSELDRAAKSFDLLASTTQNSKTFMRQEMSRRMDAFTQPDDPMSTLARGEPIDAAKRGVQALTGMTPDRALRQKDKIYAEIADVLTRNGIPAADALKVMRVLGAHKVGTAQVGQAIRSLGDKMAPRAAYLTSQKTLQ